MRMSARALHRHRQAQFEALSDAMAATPALAGHAGKPLPCYPVTEIAEMRANYGQWSSLGLSDEALRAMADAAEASETTGDVSAGWSTGSGGGTRGLFVADATERVDYIGQSLARLLPWHALLRPQRIALHLRAGSDLYSDVGQRRISFRHFPLSGDIADTAQQLHAFAPTILIAPAHRLLGFVDAGLRLPRMRYLFHGSEPMSEAERAVIFAHFALPPRAIWQATEGFLAAECAHGRLHLNDHSMAIELEPIPGTLACRPVITDLRRRSQPVVRLRGDDVVERLPGAKCSCGFAGRIIRAPQSRVGDIWRFGETSILPREVVDAVEKVLGGATRWQAIASPEHVTLRTDPRGVREQAEGAREALQALVPVAVELRRDLPPWPGPKRRKVVWHG
ncbi:Adenylate-forming enzyme [Aurantiacibacter gangjinensis]|nr:Adenylate-forming enzyme [Aurantiacibacter gangjinensis]